MRQGRLKPTSLLTVSVTNGQMVHYGILALLIVHCRGQNYHINMIIIVQLATLMSSGGFFGLRILGVGAGVVSMSVCLLMCSPPYLNLNLIPKPNQPSSQPGLMGRRINYPDIPHTFLCHLCTTQTSAVRFRQENHLIRVRENVMVGLKISTQT